MSKKEILDLLEKLQTKIYYAMQVKLDNMIVNARTNAEIEISDLVLDNMDAQQTISDLELDIIELKGE